MHITSNKNTPATTVEDLFFQPLDQVIDSLENRYPCPQFGDEDWLKMGVQRALEEVQSGRAFLQEHGIRFPNPPKLSNYFESLKSPRRGQLAQEANLAVEELAKERLPDRLADLPGLENYEVFALDGHWHRGAAHDGRHKGAKIATGHFFSLNLRIHTLRHLAVNQYPKEHDMHVLKRLKPRGLRHGVPQGRRVLHVYDKAGIDFKFWQRCRKECAVYFLSRVKEDMVYEWLDDFDWEPEDPINAGVTADRRVHTTEGIPMRIIDYTDPATGEHFEFLTNEMDLPPGVLVELYRRRWEIEKVFDELKNKLGERKSWSSDLQAKAAQGQLVALTHNLL